MSPAAWAVPAVAPGAGGYALGGMGAVDERRVIAAYNKALPDSRGEERDV